jgi:hypothetical protein
MAIYRNYSRKSAEILSSERDSWEREVSTAKAEVEEIIKAKRLSKGSKKIIPFIPVPCPSKTYCSE